jgi:hypothetical protein
MGDRGAGAPPPKKGGKPDRARAAAALRANLARRKAQARAKTASPATGDQGPGSRVLKPDALE